MDRAVTAAQVTASQTPEGVSFLQSRLPDQEKLDSILEHQVIELEKLSKALFFLSYYPLIVTTLVGALPYQGIFLSWPYNIHHSYPTVS